MGEQFRAWMKEEPARLFFSGRGVADLPPDAENALEVLIDPTDRLSKHHRLSRTRAGKVFGDHTGIRGERLRLFLESARDVTVNR